LKIVDIRPVPSYSDVAAIEAALAKLAGSKESEQRAPAPSKWIAAARAEAVDDGIHDRV